MLALEEEEVELDMRLPLFIYLSIFFLCVCLFICLSVCLSVCLYLSVSACLSLFFDKRQNTFIHSNFHQPRLPPAQWQCLSTIRLIAHTVAKILRHAGPCPRGITVKTKGSMT